MYVKWGRISRIDNPAAYAQAVLVRAFLTHRRRRSAGERPVGGFPEPGTAAAGGAATDPELRLTLLQALGSCRRRTVRCWCCGTGRTAASRRPPTR